MADNDPDDLSGLPLEPTPEQLPAVYALVRRKLARANPSVPYTPLTLPTNSKVSTSGAVSSGKKTRVTERDRYLTLQDRSELQ